MSQEVALQLIVLGGTFITSATTVILAWIAMKNAGQAKEKAAQALAQGEVTHGLINSRFDQWKWEQAMAARNDAVAEKAKGNLEGRAALLAEQQAAAGQRAAGNVVGRAELTEEQKHE